MVFEKTIEQVINENYVYARALHYLGIDFFDEPHRKLKDICEERGLDRKKVIKSFYAFDSSPRIAFSELEQYPLELLTEYLKHAHHVFIKEKLPFITHLSRQWDREEIGNLLPEFIEDFIHHIYEEEDSTFKYIELLCQASKGSATDIYSIYRKMDTLSLQAEFEAHLQDDDFGAIRHLISSVEAQNLHEKVLIREIQAFDREMIYHAEIENQLFFPKAVQLEEVVKKKIQKICLQN